MQRIQPLITLAPIPLEEPARGLRRHGRWFWLAWLAALLDGKLLLAIALSGIAYQVVQTGQSWPGANWSQLMQWLDKTLQRMSCQPLGIGVLTFVGTYAAATSLEVTQGWAAAVFLSLGLLGGLRLASAHPARRQLPGPRSARAVPNDAASMMSTPPPGQGRQADWQHLSDPDPLKRLLAIRTLSRWGLTQAATTTPYLPGTTVTLRSHLIDCLRLRLTCESEPLVRMALVEALKALQPRPQLPPGQPAMPPLTARLAQSTRQRSVDYVEP